jgi:N-acetylglutamate synthase-like GNAT family acetyltransferase
MLKFEEEKYMFQISSYKKDEYYVTTDPQKMEINIINQLLSDSYWAKNRPIEVTKKSLNYSLCFALYHKEKMIGFARVITDTVTFGYLSDVIISPNYRGYDLGKWLIECILKHPDTEYISRMWLATHDAHELYRKYGFSNMPKPENYMERVNSEAHIQYVHSVK